jgi:hypothetical protein
MDTFEVEWLPRPKALSGYESGLEILRVVKVWDDKDTCLAVVWGDVFQNSDEVGECLAKVAHLIA